jgi:hypothetical protein
LVIIPIRTRPENHPADVFERVEKGRDNQKTGGEGDQNCDAGEGDFSTKL